MSEYFVPPDFDDSASPSPEFSENSKTSELDAKKEELSEFYLQQDFEDVDPAGKLQRPDPSLFNSSEFMEEGTLLTNIEDYAKKIRGSADRYGSKIRHEAELFRSEIELELANALLIRKEAEEEAQELLAKSQIKHEEAIKAGREEGFQAGLSKGIIEFENQNQENTKRLLTLIEQIESLRTDLIFKYEKQIAELSLQVAQKIVHRNIQSEPDMVLQMVKSVVQQFEGQGNVRIRINPEEYAFIAKHQAEIKKYLDEEQVVKLHLDNNVKPSCALIESDFLAVDLDLIKQFKSMQKIIAECIDERKAVFNDTRD